MRTGWLCALVSLVGVLSLTAQTGTGIPAPKTYLIRDIRIIPEAGKEIAKGEILVKDGFIVDAAPKVFEAPGDAVIIDGKGKTAYPAFIDAGSTRGYDPAMRKSEGGPPAPESLESDILIATKPDARRGMTPEFATRNALIPDTTVEAWRQSGFAAQYVVPEGGFFSGTSSLLSYSGATQRTSLLARDVAQHAALRNVPGQEYPRALMGVFAHTRQALLDADHLRRNRSGIPVNDPCLEALQKCLPGGSKDTASIPVCFEADTADEILRALNFAAEFKIIPIIVGGREAYKVTERLAKDRVKVVLRMYTEEPPEPDSDFPPPPEPKTPRPKGPNGPNAKIDPAAPATTPPNRGRRNREATADVSPIVKAEAERRRWSEARCAFELHKAGVPFALSTQGFTEPAKFKAELQKLLDVGLSEDALLKALTQSPAALFRVDANAKATPAGSIVRGNLASFVIADGDPFDPKTQTVEMFVDGIRFEYETKPRKADARKPRELKPQPLAYADLVRLISPIPPELLPKQTEIDADRKPLTPPGDLILEGATIITATGQTIENGRLMITGGKISLIGKASDPFILPTVGSYKTIDLKGRYIMPGIIDTHAHFAISGGVNEFSLSVVPEVRVRDVIDSTDVEIYRALAGGVTTARLLHGSANVVGGQDAVIKLRYGQNAEGILLTEAVRGCKFALGENVKRTDGRFPNTRMGVEAVLIRAFSEAQEYAKRRDAWKASMAAANPADRLPEPRRDLRLEALADIIAGDIKVHCHCYRSDEILMLLRTADRFGIKVKSLQHVLEGYKVAPEVFAHGASVSLFADWWAYKIEAFDAIPWAASMMAKAGVNVTLKSDSNELVRHLYQEATKPIKYGGMSPDEAIKLITINAAKQLGLDARLGSIELGKDADLAIFSGHPLNAYSRCEMTLVDGKVYFERREKLPLIPEAAIAPKVDSTAEVKVPTKTGTYILTGAEVHLTDRVISGGTVIVSNGRIEKVLNKGESYSKIGEVMDLKGLHLYPGMIDAGTVLGLVEIGSAKETQDFSDGGDYQPDLRAATAINPESELIPVTRANGVLSVVTRPTGPTIAGQGALISLAGWTPKEMSIIDPLALHIEFPPLVPFMTGDPVLGVIGRAVQKKQREEKIKRVKELFNQAIRYDDARSLSSATPVNPRLEALVPYARGQKPIVIQAWRKADILDTLKLAEEMKWKLILSGATEAWKTVDEIKKAGVPVIYGPATTMAEDGNDPYDSPFRTPAKLHEAGIRFCIRSNGSSNTRNLPYEAAMAVSYGLPPEVALKAVTSTAADILGASKELGAIEVGRRASLVITNGDMLQPSTVVKYLMIDGVPMPATSRQSALSEKYMQRIDAMAKPKK